MKGTANHMEDTPKPEPIGKFIPPTKSISANVTPAKPAVAGAAPVKPLSTPVKTSPPGSAKAAAAGGFAPSATPARSANAPAPQLRTPGQGGAPTKPGATDKKGATIEAKIDVGFGNKLYLRGQGGGLSWDTGVPLTCIDGKTWRLSIPCTDKLTFKLLLNDSVWAQGKDLVVWPGQKVEVVPAF